MEWNRRSPPRVSDKQGEKGSEAPDPRPRQQEPGLQACEEAAAVVAKAPECQSQEHRSIRALTGEKVKWRHRDQG